MNVSRAAKSAEIQYPESDGKPMAETDVHRDWILTNIERLRRFFAGRRVYVSGNLLIYYVPGNPRKSVAPDTFVVKNCSRRRRRVFKIWEEGKGPDFILETTSRKTRREDQGRKKELYALLQVPEYFLYDPLGEWLEPPLQGFRLRNGEYEPIAPEADGSLLSEELGIRFLLENGALVMRDARTGKHILSYQESGPELEKRVEDLQKELDRMHKKANGRRGT